MTEPFVDGVKVDTWSVKYPEFAEDLQDVLTFINSKSDIALFKLRRIIEKVVKRAYGYFTALELPEDSSLSNLIKNPAFAAEVPLSIQQAMHSIRMTGNRAVHGESVTSAEAAREIDALHHVLEWSSAWFGESSLGQYLPATRAVTLQERQAALSHGTVGLAKSREFSHRGGIAVGIGMILLAISMVWLYVRNFDAMLNYQQQQWLKRPRGTSVGDAVILTHPSPQPLRGSQDRSELTHASSFARESRDESAHRSGSESCVEATSQDPDGYTNIRSGPSVRFRIITTVTNGEVFCVISRGGNWWKIRNAGGSVGYIYFDRVRLR